MTEDEFEYEKTENQHGEPIESEDTTAASEPEEAAAFEEEAEVSEPAAADGSETEWGAEPFAEADAASSEVETEAEEGGSEESGAEEYFKEDVPEDEGLVFDADEIYIPVSQTAKKEKKPLSSWTVSLITAVLTCFVMLILYTAFIMPYVKQTVKKSPKAVISYVESENKESAEKDGSAVGTVVDKCMPAIVSISGKLEYESFFGISTQAVSGTGMVISENGYILTSNALVGAKGEIKAKIGDKTYDANVVGRDVSKDLAVVKVDADGLDAVTFGDSDGVKIGDSVIAIADVFGGEIGLSASKGIVCGVNKGVELSNGTKINILQTDAAPGSSCQGGCIIDSGGNVIGMLTKAISANSERIAFAIPSNDIKSVMESIINTGDTTETLIIGIKGADTDHGVNVESVAEDSPAEKAGVKQGDLILKVDGNTVKTVDEINRIRDSHKKGDTIVFTVYRDGEMLKIDIEL